MGHITRFSRIAIHICMSPVTNSSEIPICSARKGGSWKIRLTVLPKKILGLLQKARVKPAGDNKFKLELAMLC